MRAKRLLGLGHVIGSLLLPTVAGLCFGEGAILRLEGDKVRLTLPSTLVIPGQGTTFPEYTVKRSTNLVHWAPIGGKMRAISGRSGPTLSLEQDRVPEGSFFSITADPTSGVAHEMGAGGADVFGFDRLMAQELQGLGFMSVEEFGASTPQPAYPSGIISWNPTTAQYWTAFDTNTEFHLNSQELAMFLTNGFVVSERLGMDNFGDLYYRIFHRDLPVFVTSDSILQAWHRTYLGVLEELEELQLVTLLEEINQKIIPELWLLWFFHGDGPLRNSILDADYYLTVGYSLLAGTQIRSYLEEPGQDQRVAATLDAIKRQQLQEFEIFGARRWIDFSQFTVRGHYTNSERLRRYFQAMMWFGRIDLRLATFPPNQEDDIRQLGTAIVLNFALNDSGQFGKWSVLEQVTRAFVGTTDSMTFAQLNALLAEAGIRSPADVSDLVTLTNLQTRLLTGELGVQSITSDHLFSPLSSEELKLPRSFTFCGQKFVLDSWALSQVVFDKVHWPSENCDPYCEATNVCTKVIRRKPSCLDVAFSVFANDQVASEIIRRITSPDGVAFRDGLPYQHNLMAARRVVDSEDPAAWTKNIYTAWLAALRALSEPTTDAQYPEAMRTRAWAMKTLNTQLASWTQLRHDTVLYAKQPYTPPFFCSYPFGFVEPRPAFWKQMKLLATVAANAIATLPLTGEVVVPGRIRDPWTGYTPSLTNDLAEVKMRQIDALRDFADTMATLQGIAEKELAQLPLSAAETDFLRSIMEYLGVCHVAPEGFTGWYPSLFYLNVFWLSTNEFPDDNNTFDDMAGCAMFDALVTDVHTDTPDVLVCDPGAVLHEGVGNVHLLLIAVDNGADRMVYAGPVLSHYEFELPGVNRMTDEQWKEKVLTRQIPPPPEWTRCYLAPTQ